MSWLKKLFAPDPPPRVLSDREKREVAKSARWAEDRRAVSECMPEITAGVRGRIEEELTLLADVWLPLPTQLSPAPGQPLEWDTEYEIYDYSVPLDAVKIENPQFAIPKFHYYVAMWDRQGQPAYYLIPDAGNSQREELSQAYENSEMVEFLARFPGRWFNRDPYLYFYECNSKKFRGWSPSYVLDKHRARVTAPPLHEVAGIPHDEMARMDRVMALYRGLSKNLAPPLPKVLGSLNRALKSYEFPHYGVSELLALNLPFPMFPAEQVTLKIIPPPVTKQSVMRDIFHHLPPLEHPLSFELSDMGAVTTFRIVCSPQDRGQISRQLRLALPQCGIIEQAAEGRGRALHSLTLTLPEYTLAAVPDGRVDALTQVFDLLESSGDGETVALQFVCWPFPSAVANKFIQTMNDGYFMHVGEDSYHVHRNEAHCNRIKNRLPLWQVTVRLLASNPQTLTKIKIRYFDQFAPPDNPWVAAAGQETLERRDMSQHVLLSTAELASLAHFPYTEIRSGRLETASMKAKLPPGLFTSGEVRIGTSEARGQTKPVSLPDAVRSRHLYVVGKSGSGKSTLIINIAAQDIERGEGVCVIDPHGDLVSDLLDRIPEHRVKDTVYFNVSDRAHPIGLDMMNAKSEAEIEILTDDLVTTFRRLTETWGERMETILRYSFNTLLRAPGATFIDLQKLLTNEGWRSSVVRKLDFPPLADFWFNQYANMPKDAAQPILSRMTKIVLSPTLNAIFGQSSNTLNFNDVIRNRKILLVNLGGDSRDRDNEQLAVSDEMKKLIGSVVVSQLQLAAMRQASVPEAERVPCRFFVDEFQNFVSGAFPKILSEARKYKLCLTVAHQYISQLDDATRNAVFGNVGTMIVMPLGQKDAAYLGAELGSYTPEDVANLSPERHDALCRPSTQAADTFLFTTLAPKPITRSFANTIIEHTRTDYSARPEEERPAPEPIEPGESSRTKVPMRELPKEFASTAEKALHYIRQANYLTTSQIIELCYSHLSDASKRPAASRDLKKLVETRKLKVVNWGDGKVFFVGSQCNPTAHNVAVRDILVRIFQSGYEMAEVNLAPTLGALSPDMLVSFLCENGSLLPTYWEYDAGTEGITEIQKKAARYAGYSTVSRVSFVCNTRERVQAIMKSVPADFIEYCVLDELTHLAVPAFVSRTRSDKYSYF
jgi:hypothetical protein